MAVHCNFDMLAYALIQCLGLLPAGPSLLPVVIWNFYKQGDIELVYLCVNRARLYEPALPL